MYIVNEVVLHLKNNLKCFKNQKENHKLKSKPSIMENLCSPRNLKTQKKAVALKGSMDIPIMTVDLWLQSQM